jgi:hypothetical protein
MLIISFLSLLFVHAERHVLKSIFAREATLQKIAGVAVFVQDGHLSMLSFVSEDESGENLGLVQLCDKIRYESVCVVEAIVLWRATQHLSPAFKSKPFNWNNQNYLLKMQTDLNFLCAVPSLVEALRFDIFNNFFLVEPVSLGRAIVATNALSSSKTSFESNTGKIIYVHNVSIMHFYVCTAFLFIIAIRYRAQIHIHNLCQK